MGAGGIQPVAGRGGRAAGDPLTLIEPIGYDTDWSGPSSITAEPLPAYEPIREARRSRNAGSGRGTPEATGAAILAVVDSEDPPLRLFLGNWALEMIRAEYEGRLEEWERWQPVAVDAHG